MKAKYIVLCFVTWLFLAGPASAQLSRQDFNLLASPVFVAQHTPTASPAYVPRVPTYAEQRQLSLQTGKPLIVFVRTPVRAYDWAITYWASSFAEVDGSAIVVGAPRDGDLDRFDLPATATDVEVRNAASRRVHSPPPVMFAPQPQMFQAPSFFGGGGGRACRG